MTTAANAKAAEIKHTADAGAYRFDADRRAYAAGGKAFLMERRYGKLEEGIFEASADDRRSPHQVNGGSHSRSASDNTGAFARDTRDRGCGALAQVLSWILVFGYSSWIHVLDTRSRET